MGYYGTPLTNQWDQVSQGAKMGALLVISGLRYCSSMGLWFCRTKSVRGKHPLAINGTWCCSQLAHNSADLRTFTKNVLGN